MSVRFINCEVCQTEGRILKSDGGPDDIDCGICPVCNGECVVEIEAEPVELEDIQPVIWSDCLPDYECENCIGMIEHGCYCRAVGAIAPGGPLALRPERAGEVSMARNISFSLTTPQFLAGTKDVTRRMGWDGLKTGDTLRAVKKAMGLKKGEKMEALGYIRVVNVRREPLRRILDDLEYGFSETLREGFPLNHPYHWPSEFVDFFCRTHAGCFPEREITRIEFEKIVPASTPDLHGEGSS